MGGSLTFFAVVRGPLGAGKTTVSERVAAAVGGHRVGIDEILERHDLEEWRDGYISESSFLRANDYAAARAVELLGQGTPAVVDGNFYWKSVVEDLLGKLPYPHAVFTLKVPLSVCIARDARRDPPHGADGARAVFAKVTSFEFGFPIDAAGTIEAAVGSILDVLEREGLAKRAGRPASEGRGSYPPDSTSRR